LLCSTRQFAVLAAHSDLHPARDSSGDIHPNQRSRAEQRRSITTSSQRRPSERNSPRSASTLPKCLIRNPESARFSLFTITKGPRVTIQGENFTTEYFYRLNQWFREFY
jgi:hypothetical protein